MCVNWAHNKAVKSGTETAAHVSVAERLGVSDDGEFPCDSENVIRRWLKAYPDIVLDENIAIHFTHIF